MGTNFNHFVKTCDAGFLLFPPKFHLKILILTFLCPIFQNITFIQFKCRCYWKHFQQYVFLWFHCETPKFMRIESATTTKKWLFCSLCFSYYLPCQVSNQNSYRKFDYYNCDFPIVIGLLPLLNPKNDQDTILRVSDVKYSTRVHFDMQGDRCEGCTHTSGFARMHTNPTPVTLHEK